MFATQACLAALVAVLVAPLAATGCADKSRRGPEGARTAPPGFSADTFTREGLISGATATEAGCRALADGLWVGGVGRRECLRYGIAGTDGRNGTAVVYIPGDPGGAAYSFAAGTPGLERASEHYELSEETRNVAADAMSGAMGGFPVVLLARPGMHGASGNHARDRHSEDEVGLVDDALTQLRQRLGFRDFALFGFSSGGTVAANLLARRTDIHCAVIGSAPLDLAQIYQRQDGTTLDYFVMRNGRLADPMRSVAAIRERTPIYVIGDRRDRIVPASAWDAWVAAARRAGLRVHIADTAGFERPELGGNVETHHQTTSRGMEVAHACATDVPPDRVLKALREDEPLLPPHGRRLRGREIIEALAGRTLRGSEWYPRVNILGRWEADGVLTYLDLQRGERRIDGWRWHVEEDRLCTARHGCGGLLADGRFLHFVTDAPPRIRITLVAAPPVPRRGLSNRP